jgi:prevent-host-death family protein
MDVGIRELRTNLAAIMDAVDKGTVVTITHHGKPRATIQPVAAPEESVVERGIREGWLSVGPGYYDTSRRGNRRPPMTAKSLPGVRLDDVTAADRADR